MGVSGSGKSTLAQYISQQIGAEFIEADNHHPPENIALMRSGTPLTDAHREPWIQALCDIIKASRSNNVLAYSGLRYEHRQRFLNLARPCLILNLNISHTVVVQRLASRARHFMPSSLIASQFAAMDDIRPCEPVKDIHSDMALEQAQTQAMKYVNAFMAGV